MSQEKIVMGWAGAPLGDLHLNERQEPWPSHLTEGDGSGKEPFNPATDGVRLDALGETDYVMHFGGNSHNAAVANVADRRFCVHELWAQGKTEQARAIAEDMARRGIVSHGVLNPAHDNGGSVIKAMGSDRRIITLPRTPLHETVKAEHVRDFLRIKNLGGLGISSLKSPELNEVFADMLTESDKERAHMGLDPLFTSHNPGSGGEWSTVADTWQKRNHGLVIGNREEFGLVYGAGSAQSHAENALEFADFAVCSDGTKPLQIAYRSGALQDTPQGGALEIVPSVLDKSRVVDTTGAGDRLTSVFTSGIAYAKLTGELTLSRLASIGEFAACEAASVIQAVGGHGDKPYPIK